MLERPRTPTLTASHRLPRERADFALAPLLQVQLAFATGLTYSLYQWSFQFALFPKYRYGVGLWLMAGVCVPLPLELEHVDG